MFLLHECSSLSLSFHGLLFLPCLGLCFLDCLAILVEQVYLRGDPAQPFESSRAPASLSPLGDMTDWVSQRNPRDYYLQVLLLGFLDSWRRVFQVPASFWTWSRRARWGPNVILPHVDVQLSLHHCWRDRFSPMEWSWPTCRKSIDRKCTRLLLGLSSVPSVCPSVLMRVTLYIVVSFEIGTSESANFAVLFQNWFWLFDIHSVHVNLRISFTISIRRALGLLMEGALTA